MIVGKFARHTDDFYEWRVRDRRGRLALHDSGVKDLDNETRAGLYDDLAVALEKLGRRDEALTALSDKTDRLPGVGAYETAANRGTILVHAGRLEAGMKEIDRALEINPDAHFGRERIQKLLVEYLLEKRGDAAAIPLPVDPDPDQRGVTEGPVGFAAFLEARGVSAGDGLEGVRGMLRFGDYRSPALLEALGDLLLGSGEDDADDTLAARQLAARAYLAAGRSAPGAAGAYRAIAAVTLENQKLDGRDARVDQIAGALDREFAETDAWFTKLAEDEELWIESSPDPDARFRQKYGPAVLRVGDVTSRPAHIEGHWAADGLTWPMAAAVGVGGALTWAAVFGLVRLRGRRTNGWE